MIKVFVKSWDQKVQSLTGSEKVYLLKKQGQTGYQQKQGTPPPPEEVAPNQKQVYEPWKMPRESSWQHSSWQQQWSSGGSWEMQQLLQLECELQAMGTSLEDINITDLWGPSQWHRPAWKQPYQSYSTDQKGRGTDHKVRNAPESHTHCIKRLNPSADPSRRKTCMYHLRRL